MASGDVCVQRHRRNIAEECCRNAGPRACCPRRSRALHFALHPSVAPPPPSPDFTLNVSPVSASAVVGNTSSAVTISFTPKNGFSNPVTVTLSALPAEVTSSPSSPLTIPPGGTQSVSFSVPVDAPTGVFPLNVSGAGGSISHSTHILLTSEPTVPCAPIRLDRCSTWNLIPAPTWHASF